MTLCETCGHAIYHGYPPEGSPEREVGSICFWCEELRDHEQREFCGYYGKGEPKRFDKRGREM